MNEPYMQSVSDVRSTRYVGTTLSQDEHACDSAHKRAKDPVGLARKA